MCFSGIVGIGSDTKDAHFTWKVVTWLCVLVELVRTCGIGSDTKDAHFMWKVVTWLCVLVELVRTWLRRPRCTFHMEN